MSPCASGNTLLAQRITASGNSYFWRTARAKTPDASISSDRIIPWACLDCVDGKAVGELPSRVQQRRAGFPTRRLQSRRARARGDQRSPRTASSPRRINRAPWAAHEDSSPRTRSAGTRRPAFCVLRVFRGSTNPEVRTGCMRGRCRLPAADGACKEAMRGASTPRRVGTTKHTQYTKTRAHQPNARDVAWRVSWGKFACAPSPGTAPVPGRTPHALPTPRGDRGRPRSQEAGCPQPAGRSKAISTLD